MTTSEAILNSLVEDLALEHGAIVQYAHQGIMLHDSAITSPIRQMAREEMWHFEWLAEAIRDRGGKLTLDRAEVFLFPSTAESMDKDVDTEQMAIDHYAQTLKIIGDSDPDLTALIERIVADEQNHHREFSQLAEKVRANGEEAYAPHIRTDKGDLMEVIKPTIMLEYGSILQYLWNKYGSGDCELAEQHFELAIDEMRHLSWVGEYMPGLAPPMPMPVPADHVHTVSSPEQAVEAARMIERHSAMHYAEKTPEAHSPELARDLARVAGQHAYHRYLLGEE